MKKILFLSCASAVASIAILTLVSLPAQAQHRGRSDHVVIRGLR